MAQALRDPLSRRGSPSAPSGFRWRQARAWLAALPALAILGPVLPGLYWALAPSLDLSVWRALWSDVQWPQALRTTLVSAGLGSVLGMALAAGLATALYPGPRWLAMQRRLPLMLSVPHAAFAVGLLFLISPSGWLARAVAPLAGWIDPPAWTTVQDPLGLSLALALGLKESWFLLWVLVAVLGEQTVHRHMVVARSLGLRWVISTCGSRRSLASSSPSWIGYRCRAVMARSCSLLENAVSMIR